MTPETLRAAIADLEEERQQIEAKYLAGEIDGTQAARFDKDIQQEIDDCLYELSLWLENNDRNGFGSYSD
jgi:hypothetical protein